eukprot:COSAG05_NODE_11717_length_500_cov_0.982544_1_plen_31_part_01
MFVCVVGETLLGPIVIADGGGAFALLYVACV